MNKIIAAIVAFGTLGVLLTLAGTSALFTDSGQSTGNTANAATLQVPGLTAVASGTSVNLTWNNPDSLGTGGGYSVVRANGTCPAGSATVTGTVVGTPAAGTTSLVDTPPSATGTATYCYGVNSTLYNWVSGQGKAGTSLSYGPPPITTLKFDSAAPASSNCSATKLLQSGVVNGSVDIATGSTVTWAATADGLTTLPSGTYQVTLTRLDNVGANTSAAAFTVEIGVCSAGSYVQKGITVGPGFTGNPQTLTVNVSVAAATTLDSTHFLMVRINNTQPGNSKNNNINLDTSGASFMVAPARMN